VLVSKTGTSATITWNDPPGPYNIYRGSIQPGQAWTYDQSCMTTGTPLQSTIDPLVPQPETSFYYLVSRVNECRESVIGRNSAGAPDPNTNACSNAPITSMAERSLLRGTSTTTTP
jgi:hypothetical protein